MSNTYSWNFTQLTAYPTYETQTNVVYTVHWIFIGTSDTDPLVTSQLYGTQNITYVADDDFIPYDQLTADIIQSWVTASMGIDAVNTLQTVVDQQIADIITPQSINLPTPWN